MAEEQVVLKNEEGKPHRRTTAVRSTVFTVIALVIVLLATNQLDLWSDAVSDSEGEEIHTMYDYRQMGIEYDSLNVRAVYGEMFVIDNDAPDDSIHVNATVWYDTSCIYGSKSLINSALTWKKFANADDLELTFFKGIMLTTYNEPNMNLNFPDTVAWTLRLYNGDNDNYIATLDSIVLFSRMEGTDYPDYEGFSGDNTWETVSISLAEYIQGDEADSLYLKAEIDPFFGQTSNYWVSDDFRINSKFSEEMQQLEKQSRPTDMSTVHTGVFSLEAYPNPMQRGQQLSVNLDASQDFTGRLVLINSLGQVVHTFVSGDLAPNSYSYTYSAPSSLPSGTYYLSLADQHNVVLEHTEIVVIK